MISTFPNITTQQIFLFLKNYVESQIKDIRFLRSKYNNHDIGFDFVLEFMNKINFIKILDNNLSVNDEILNSMGENFLNINELLLEKLLIIQNSYSEEIRQFFKHTKIDLGNSTININHQANYSYSNLRNFLTLLGLFLFNAIEKTYKINPELIYFIIDYINANDRISLDTLSKIHENEKLLGDKAELEIMTFEKERLKEFPHLLNKIVHIALNNSAAGYDIRSFELPLDSAGKIVPRYIEVKSVSIQDYKFYWSRNEMHIANVLGNKYFLYLLPIHSKNIFELDNLMIINDPFKNIYLNEIDWRRKNESISFSKNNYY